MAENQKTSTSDSSNPLENNIQKSNSIKVMESDEEKLSPPKPEATKKRKRRMSSIGRQFANLEKQLMFDNIRSRVKGMFYQSDETPNKEELESDSQRKSLSPSMAALFIVSTTTGSGFQNLPHALKESSWLGVFIIMLFCLNSLYAGLCTGWGWVIMEEQWPQYLEYTRIPYQDLGYRAIGTWMKYFIGICVDITCMSSCAVYIIIISSAVEMIAYRYITFCPTLMITSVILMPFMLFNSYKDMKFIAVFDVLASILYCVLVIVNLFCDPSSEDRSDYTDPSYESIALGFAAISFSYGGGAVYPNILADMTDRSEYSQANGTAWLIVLGIYFFMPILAYAAYGDLTQKTIIKNTLMKNELYGLSVTAEIIFILQIASTFAISLMPSMLSFEERLNCPNNFCWFRVLIRISIMVILMLVVLGLPYLPMIANFVGSTFMNLLSFVIPPIFYVRLVYKRDSRLSRRVVSKKEILLLIEMLLLAMFILIISTYVSLEEFMSSWTKAESCYFNYSFSTNYP